MIQKYVRSGEGVPPRRKKEYKGRGDKNRQILNRSNFLMASYQISRSTLIAIEKQRYDNSLLWNTYLANTEATLVGIEMKRKNDAAYKARPTRKNIYT